MTDAGTGTPVWLVVGLGNPGPAYAGHRHNIGYLVNDELARRLGSSFRAHKSGRADVVPVPRVSGAGVAQSDDEERPLRGTRVGHRCARGAGSGVRVGLLALDAGLGLGLGELGLQGLGRRGTEEADDERLGVGDQRGTAGQDQVTGGDVLTGGPAGHVDLDAVRQTRGVGLDLHGAQLVVGDRVGGDLTDDHDRHLDGGLLAAADE